MCCFEGGGKLALWMGGWLGGWLVNGGEEKAPRSLLLLV